MTPPLQINCRKVAPTGQGSVIEVYYTIVDARGEEVSPASHFTCKAEEFEIVSKYTLERFAASLAAAPAAPDRSHVAAAAEVLAVVDSLRAAPAEPPVLAEATPLDQVISPPGATGRGRPAR